MAYDINTNINNRDMSDQGTDDTKVGLCDRAWFDLGVFRQMLAA